MEWAVLAIAIIFVFIAYVVLQGTRAALAYRRQAAAGDVSVIREVAEEQIQHWKSAKRPQGVAPDVWRGIQSIELVEVGPDYVRVACQAEGQYKLFQGKWMEIASPLSEGMAITAKAADLLLYELPNVRLDKAQIDVYTTFRRPSGRSSHECILSTIAQRQVARALDWDKWTPREIVDALGGRYRLSDSGEPGEIQPIDPDAVSVSPKGGRNRQKAARHS